MRNAIFYDNARSNILCVYYNDNAREIYININMRRMCTQKQIIY